MGNNYNQRLDELFCRWMGSLSEEEQLLFCKDGLLIKSDRPSEFVDEQWGKARRRVLFLLKDKNTPDGDDIRLWLVDERNGKNNRRLAGGGVGRTGFLPNLARLLYGLLVTEKDVRMGFEEVKKSRMGEVRTIWNTEPFGFVESKKLAGYSSVSSKMVTDAMERDEAFLKEEPPDNCNGLAVTCCGALAQLGERKVRNLEARGSIPLRSTIRPVENQRVYSFGGG